MKLLNDLIVTYALCALGTILRDARAADLAGPDFFHFRRIWDRNDAWKPPARPGDGGLQSVADCHFTIAGYVKPEDIPLCEKLSLVAIVAPRVSPESRGFGIGRNLATTTSIAVFG